MDVQPAAREEKTLKGCFVKTCFDYLYVSSNADEPVKLTDNVSGLDTGDCSQLKPSRDSRTRRDVSISFMGFGATLSLLMTFIFSRRARRPEVVKVTDWLL